MSRRASLNDPWGPPQNLGPKINTSANEVCPFVTPDGSKLIFVSDRPGGTGGQDFYIATRTNLMDDLAWDNVQQLTELNSTANEFGPSGYEDPVNGALTIFFSSNRPGGPGGNDIYTSTLGADGKFTAPKLVAELSTPDNDAWPNVLSNGLELVLISNRAGTVGGNDVWISDRGSLSDRWSTPVNLGPTVNSSAAEGRAWIYAGGTRILFFSAREGGSGGDDLYETTRVRTSVIPVAGSTTGYGGTTFTTSAQITNTTASRVSGTIVFHPQGQSASAGDPRMSYTLNAFETRTFSDLMSSIGTTGVGSLEVVPSEGAAPVITAQILDGGVTPVPQLTSDMILTAGSRAALVAPADFTKFRFNIGVLTFAAGATLTVGVYDAAGNLVRSTDWTLPPNYFAQMPAASFARGDVGALQTVIVSVTAGSAALYGSTAANSGGASVLQMAVRTP